jgi:hypothetical protein
MGKRFIITEEEKNHISNLYGMINENFIQTIVSKIANSSLYKKVTDAWDPNPQTFVQNMIKLIPGLKTVEKQFLNKVQELSNLSPEEKENVINQNKDKIEQEVKKAETKQVSEQIQIFLTVAFAVALIYIIVKISTQENPKKRDERLKNERDAEQLKRQEQERKRQEEIEQEKLKYEPQNNLLKSNFLAKTLNLYDDVNQQTINNKFSPFKITSVSFQQVNASLKGVVITGNSPESIEGMLGGKLVAMCKANPDEFSSSMAVVSNIGDTIKIFYNKPFTDKLNQIGKQWCEKPKADFGLRQTTDSSIPRTA